MWPFPISSMASGLHRIARITRVFNRSGTTRAVTLDISKALDRVKSKLSPRSHSVALRQLRPIHEKGS